jgi:hypothetical protein
MSLGRKKVKDNKSKGDDEHENIIRERRRKDERKEGEIESERDIMKERL